MTQEKLDKVYEDFLKLADKKKDITDDDILVLAGADRSAASPYQTGIPASDKRSGRSFGSQTWTEISAESTLKLLLQWKWTGGCSYQGCEKNY